MAGAAPLLTAAPAGEGAKSLHLKIAGLKTLLPGRPRLGAELDEKIAAAHPCQPVSPNYVFQDGGIAGQ